MIEIGTNTINVLQMASTLRLRRSCEDPFLSVPAHGFTQPTLTSTQDSSFANRHTLAAKNAVKEPIDDDRGGRILQSFDIV